MDDDDLASLYRAVFDSLEPSSRHKMTLVPQTVSQNVSASLHSSAW
jgi:hypothetical protein